MESSMRICAVNVFEDNKGVIKLALGKHKDTITPPKTSISLKGPARE